MDKIETKPFSMQVFTLQEVECATDKFKTMIGGGFGSVCRGTLSLVQEVAVKVKSASSTQGTGEFENELNFLSTIRHDNLVPLLGNCSENDQQMLIYPSMSNGSLQDRLYGDEVALTVDLMRVLMSFAFEPAPSNAFKYNDGGTVAPAACKLLTALTDRCDSAIDPSSKSDATMFANKKVKADEPKNYESVSSNVEFKKGDWICSKCNFMNFAQNIRCQRCREDGPKTVSFNQMKMKDGDWNCPE